MFSSRGEMVSRLYLDARKGPGVSSTPSIVGSLRKAAARQLFPLRWRANVPHVGLAVNVLPEHRSSALAKPAQPAVTDLLTAPILAKVSRHCGAPGCFESLD